MMDQAKRKKAQEEATVVDLDEGKDLLEPRSDFGPAIRFGAIGLLLGFVMLVLWAALAPLDSGVPVQGTVVVDTKRKTIQNEKGGTIEKIYVHEGQVVRAGDLLLTLDSATMQAEYESARQRYLGIQAMQDRLVAESQGKSSITYSQKILAEIKDPKVEQHILAQNQLIESGRRALESELSAIQESLLGQEEENKGYAMQLESRRRQVDFIHQELVGLRELVKDGYAPRNKLLEMERQGAELAAGISELEANLARGHRAVAELKFRKIQKGEEFKRDLDSQLAEVRREVSADEEHVSSTRGTLARTEVRAPVAGSVVGFVNQTVGGVVMPGMRIMDIIPIDESLMLEAHVPPSQVDRLHVGALADVRFSAFSKTPQLAVDGILLTVSADVLADQATNTPPYYLARVQVTPNGMKQLGQRQMRPGMPAEIVIHTGEHSLLTYFLQPFYRRLAKALTEE